MVVVDPEAVQPIAVKAGYNIATITGTSNAATDAMFVWGTATGGPYPNVTPWQNPVREWSDDGTFAWRYTFALDNVQQQANTIYFGVVLFADGTQSSELTWTQPGLNANAADTVNFYRTFQTKFAKIAEIANKGANQGWLSSADWDYLRAAATYASFFNTVTWADGR